MKRTQLIKKDKYYNSNIIQLLRSFSKDEKAEFGKFVHSPFNNRSEVARFFDELKKFFPSFEKKNFSREYIFDKLYPGKSYKDDVIRKLSSNLFKLAENYISYKMFREDEYEQKKMALEYYSHKYEQKFFKIQADKTEAFLEKQSFRNAEYYYRLKQLNTSKASYFSQYDATRKKFDNTEERIYQTWQYSVIALLSIYDAAVNDMMYFNKKYNVDLLNMLLELYNNPLFKKTTAAEAYYYSLKLNTDGKNDDTFYALMNLLENNPDIFNKEELFGFYTGMHNYLFEKGLTPDPKVTKLEFEVGVKMLNLGLITEGDTISAEWFANVFLKALKANEIKYAEKFISDYKMKLSEKERDNIINYAYAELEMAKNNFKKVLVFLSKIKFNNVWEKLRVNHMYTKIHYEMNNSESFYYIIDSFRHLVKNENSVSNYVKRLHENFIKHILTLFRIKNGAIDLSLPKLKKDIMNDTTAGNYWLLKKINELETNKKG
jgi:hypothetical protein